jgi:predicted porin
VRRLFLVLLLLLFQAPLFAAAEDGTPPGEEGKVSAPSEEAVEREQGAGEDRLSQEQAELVEEPDLLSEKPIQLKVRGSARIRYRLTEGDSFWGDGGSRIGLRGRWQFRPRWWAFGTVEAGFNLLDAADQIFNPKGRSAGEGDNVSRRLLYGGISSPRGLATFGKNWSAWYQVAGFTDLFESTGASASGTYNAGTDGGNTGTGRADRTLQTRLFIDFLPQRWFKPFNLNLQVQHGEPVPQVEGVDYGTAFGASAVLHTHKEFVFGVAYNQADVTDKDDPVLRAAGIDNDARAFLVGTRAFGEKWYLATVVSRLEDHETTNEELYFDGWGWEVSGRYRIYGPLWFVGGWNLLEPDGGQHQAGDYRVRYGVAGLWYSFREFQQIIYFEARIDDSRAADGSSPGNTYAAGVRWDLP